MKKRLLTAISTVCLTMLGMAQTSLPTSWNFATTTLPTGWSSSPGFTYYAASGNPAPSAKFTVAGTDKLMIDFTTPPGNLTYDIKANVATPPGNPFSGNFLVEESANGTTWTTLHAYTSMSITAYTTMTDAPLSTTRHIRFNFVTKTNGNVSLDNVAIAAAPAGTTQQIGVKQGTTTILNGATYTLSSPVSTMTPTTFTISNLGTVNALNISSATLSGPAAADFTVATATPFAVSATSSSNLVVNFTPSSAGTRNAVLNIANDDPNANPFIINLNGIGGNLATEPTSQPTNMIFTNVKSYHLNATFTGTTPASDGYLVLRRTGAAITDVPVDGTVYQRGDMIGNSKVVYSANATGFFPNDIVANTQYYFTVFAYNGVGTYRNYLTTAPLAANTTSSGSMQPASYYSTISTSNTTLVTDLHNLTNPHTLQFYSNYGPLMAAVYYTRDTTANQRVITCVYSGLNKVYTEPFDWTANDFSREHSYCQSWQPTVNSATFQNMPEYNDYHMITPTNQSLVNAVRSNYPYGVVTGTISSQYLGCKLGLNAAGQKVFEPRDADKGDAARCMLYECIAYTGVAYTGPANTNVTYGGSWSLPNRISNSIPYGQDQNILKLWNTQDPPDNFEIGRNDYVDSLQGNRNPFIDHPEYVCNIDFSTMTYLAVPNCGIATGISEIKNEDLISFAPNPSNGNFVVNYTASKSQKISMRLYDMVGRVVYSNEMNVSMGMNSNEINVLSLRKGIYTVEIVTEAGRKTEKLVIQ